MQYVESQNKEQYLKTTIKRCVFVLLSHLSFRQQRQDQTRDGSVSPLSVGSHFSASSLDLHELIVLVLLSSSRVHSGFQRSMQHQYIL